MGSYGQNTPGRGRRGGSGTLIMVAIVVALALLVFSKKGSSPGPTAGVPAENAPPQHQDSGTAPVGARATDGDWSIEELAGKRPPSSGTADKVSRPNGDWSLEEVPTVRADRAAVAPRPTVELSTEPAQRRTTKGDWSIEEAGGNTAPASKVPLSVQGQPKATKKGDWELEVD